MSKANNTAKSAELKRFAKVDQEIYDLEKRYPRFWGIESDTPDGRRYRKLHAQRLACKQTLLQAGYSDESLEKFATDRRADASAQQIDQLHQLAGSSTAVRASAGPRIDPRVSIDLSGWSENVTNRRHIVAKNQDLTASRLCVLFDKGAIPLTKGMKDCSSWEAAYVKHGYRHRIDVLIYRDRKSLGLTQSRSHATLSRPE